MSSSFPSSAPVEALSPDLQPASRQIKRVRLQVYDDLEDSPYFDAEDENYDNDFSFDSEDSWDMDEHSELDPSLSGDYIDARFKRVLATQTFHHVSHISNRGLFTIIESPAPSSEYLSLNRSAMKLIHNNIDDYGSTIPQPLDLAPASSTQSDGMFQTSASVT